VAADTAPGNVISIKQSVKILIFPPWFEPSTVNCQNETGKYVMARYNYGIFVLSNWFIANLKQKDITLIKYHTINLRMMRHGKTSQFFKELRVAEWGQSGRPPGIKNVNYQAKRMPLLYNSITGRIGSSKRNENWRIVARQR
jgi:hypothetical protein